MAKKKVKTEKPKDFIKDGFKAFRNKSLAELGKAQAGERLLEKHRVLLSSICQLRGASIMVIYSWYGLLVVLNVPVQDMKEIEPVIALIEANLKITFNKTDDYVDAWTKVRRFENKEHSWFRVDASVKQESEVCQAVVVGYDTVPKYELRCGGEAAREVPKATHDENRKEVEEDLPL